VIHPNALIKLYDYNIELIQKQTDGMTHAESLLQPPFEANCLNWILGHLVSSRTRALMHVGEEPVWTDAQRARYRNGSEPITAEGEGVMLLEALLSDMNESHRRLVRGLQRMTYDDMCQPTGFNNESIGEQLGYLQFHEAQHVGQIIYLGQFAGKKGAWLS
jgi:hypothetical protein